MVIYGLLLYFHRSLLYKGGLKMFTTSHYKNRYRAIFISLSVLFVIAWIGLLLTFNLLPRASASEILVLKNKINLLLYFLMFDFLILTSSIISWHIKVKKINTENTPIISESEEVVSSLQIEFENQRQLLSTMTLQYNKAIEYDRIKTEFFSNISHELKTPLSVILGAIQLIDKSCSPESERRKSGKHHKTIRQNCYRLIRLINNILDITKMDSGFIKINPVNCNIVYLIEEITQSVAPFAEQKGIRLEFDTENEEILTAVDVDKIERIILNLLSNAIKFTASGGSVNVCISSMNAQVFISVKDSGLGIPEDMQKSIFERFKQVGSNLTRDFEGTGIGLSLVKSFVELHNGTIDVISEVNKGSEFIISLPIKLTSSNTDDLIETQKIQGKIIEAINIEFADIYSVAS